MPLNPRGEVHIDETGSPAFGIPDHVASPAEWNDYLAAIKVTIEVPKGKNKWGNKKITVRLIDFLVDQACKAFAEKGARPPITLEDASFLVQEYRDRRLVVVTVQHRFAPQLGAAPEDHYVVLPIVLPEQEVAWLRVTGRWKSRPRPIGELPSIPLPAILAPAASVLKH